MNRKLSRATTTRQVSQGGGGQAYVLLPGDMGWPSLADIDHTGTPPHHRPQRPFLYGKGPGAGDNVALSGHGNMVFFQSVFSSGSGPCGPVRT